MNRPTLPDNPTTKPGPGDAGESARSAPAALKAEAEERIVPDAGQTTWRLWLARNYHVFEPPAIDLVDARGAHGPAALLPAGTLDPSLRAKQRDLYRAEVDTRLSLLLQDSDDRVRGAAAIALARAGMLDDAEDAVALFRLLDDEQRRVRDQALLAASLAESSAARYHLLRLTSAVEVPKTATTESERVRTRVLSALFASLRGETSLRPLVLDLVGDSRLSTQHRALIVQALGLSGSRDAANQLVEIARDRSETGLVRAAAVGALGMLGDRSATTFVVSMLEDSDRDTEVRAAAALAVGELVNAADAELVRTLVRAHDRENNSTVARFLLLSLGRIGGVHARAEIERVFMRESADERVFAILALGLVARTTGAVTRLDPLFGALKDARIQDERCALLCALGLTGLPQALETIAEETRKASSPEVRRTGIAALELLGVPGCLPILQTLLLDDDVPEVRMQAARALARLDPAATGTLIHALGANKPRGTSERAALILCLGFTRDPGAIEPLLDLLRERGHPTQEREAATVALGLVYDPHRAAPVSRLGEAHSFLRESAEIPGLLALSE